MFYLFLLGNAPELSVAELKAVLNLPVEVVSDKWARVESSSELAPELFNRLGGTIKVAQLTGSDITPELLVDALTKEEGQRVVFGLSLDSTLRNEYSVSELTREMKQTLEDWGFKARFVTPRPGDWQLGSVIISKQHVQELLVLPIGLAKTVWVQEFEQWGKRDYGRPEAEGHLGMLPPKVGRMMVNLALGSKSEGTILDPFCGVGTILAEAISLGYSVFGSDINKDQVTRTKVNLDWLKSGKYKIQVNDARQVSKTGWKNIDAIVTEPDLGPNIKKVPSPDQLAKLEHLYVESLRDWLGVLKEEGSVVIALPSFTLSKGIEEHLVKTVIDKANLMGYSLVEGPFAYYRPQAIVRRNICHFRKYGTR